MFCCVSTEGLKGSPDYLGFLQNSPSDSRPPTSSLAGHRVLPTETQLWNPSPPRYQTNESDEIISFSSGFPGLWLREKGKEIYEQTTFIWLNPDSWTGRMTTRKKQFCLLFLS